MPNWKAYAFVEAAYVKNPEEFEADVSENSKKALHIWQMIGKYTEPALHDKMICGQKAPVDGWWGNGTFEEHNIQSIDDILDYANEWKTHGNVGKWHFCKKCYNILYRLDEREKKEATPKPKRTLKAPTGRRLTILRTIYDKAKGDPNTWVNWIELFNMRKEWNGQHIEYIEGQGNVFIIDPKVKQLSADIQSLEGDNKWLESKTGTAEWVRLLPAGVELFAEPNSIEDPTTQE